MDARLESILKEAGRIIGTYGVRNISMDDISREMGISKKTLYQHVANKADLIQKILEYNHQNYISFLQTLIPEEGNAIDQLFSVSEFVCSEMKKYKPENIYSLQKYYPELYRNFFEMKRKRVEEDLISNMKAGIEEGLYRQDLDLELTSKLYTRNMEEIHNLGITGTGEVSFEKVFQTMFENHIRAIVTPAGLAYFEEKLNASQQQPEHL